MKVDGVVYSTKSVTPFGVLKWDETLLNDNGVAVSCEVIFKKIEDDDFNRFALYRYLDIMFKDLSATLTVSIKYDAYDLRSVKTKKFYIGLPIEDMDNALGEIDTGQALVADAFGEDVDSSPFLKNRISMLVKAQTITIGLTNAYADQTFTVAQFTLSGFKEARKLFKPANIISV
jgi:hypothetical protein